MVVSNDYSCSWWINLVGNARGLLWLMMVDDESWYFIMASNDEAWWLIVIAYSLAKLAWQSAGQSRAGKSMVLSQEGPPSFWLVKFAFLGIWIYYGSSCPFHPAGHDYLVIPAAYNDDSSWNVMDIQMTQRMWTIHSMLKPEIDLLNHMLITMIYRPNHWFPHVIINFGVVGGYATVVENLLWG